MLKVPHTTKCKLIVLGLLTASTIVYGASTDHELLQENKENEIIDIWMPENDPADKPEENTTKLGYKTKSELLEAYNTKMMEGTQVAATKLLSIEKTIADLGEEQPGLQPTLSRMLTAIKQDPIIIATTNERGNLVPDGEAAVLEAWAANLTDQNLNKAIAAAAKIPTETMLDRVEAILRDLLKENPTQTETEVTVEKILQGAKTKN